MIWENHVINKNQKKNNESRSTYTNKSRTICIIN